MAMSKSGGHGGGECAQGFDTDAVTEIAERFLSLPSFFIEMKDGAEALGKLVALHVLGEDAAEARSERRCAQIDRVHIQACADDADFRGIGTGAAVRTAAGAEVYDSVGKR